MKKYHFIYITTNTLNGRYYIGVHSTDNLDDGYKGSGKLLKQAFKKYGKKNFTTKPIQFYNSKTLAEQWEEYIVDETFIQFEDNYNLTTGGGLIYHTKEIRAKISAYASGRIFSSEARKNMGASRIGLKHSEETKKKMSESAKGKIFSEETRKKMSLNSNNIGKSNPMYGKNHTTEARKKMSEANKGKIISPEQRQYYKDNFSGSNSTHAKVVRDITTNKIYGCIKEAAEDLQVTYSTLRWRLQTNSSTNTLKYENI